MWDAGRSYSIPEEDVDTTVLRSWRLNGKNDTILIALKNNNIEFGRIFK